MTQNSAFPPASTDVVNVDFEPIGRRGPCRRGLSLLQCAQSLGVGLSAICGGRGTCGRCRVALVSGELSPNTGIERSLFTPDELATGARLACQAVPLSDCIIHVPEDSFSTNQRVQVEGLQPTPRVDPPLRDVQTTVAPPSLQDVRADDDRLMAALREAGNAQCDVIDIEAARQMPGLLRQRGWQAQVTLRGREVVALGPWPSPTLGLAVDLGTTKIAAYLLDLATGSSLAARGAMNRQIRYGEDVVARLTYALSNSSGGADLCRAAIDGINELTMELCGDADADYTRVLEAVVVGNTAMHHLLLKLPVDQLARAPYVPAIRDAIEVKARETGFMSGPGAWLHLPPGIAGFVGADHVAALLAAGIHKAVEPVLLVDIGTNTEVCLAARGELTSVSCASGPAFEGGHIRDGMRAASGAIEHVQIDGNEVRLQVVDNAQPAGICGSGILDALAELASHGIIDARGKLRREHPRIRDNGRQQEFVLVPEEQRDGKPALSVTQSDVRQLQLAKAAIATGIEALLTHRGIKPAQLSSVIVAGAFGSYIDVRSAITVGMLPDIPLDRFRQVGNAAGAGAKMVLSSQTFREAARRLAREAGYLELATSRDFMNRFIDNTALATFTPHGG